MIGAQTGAVVAVEVFIEQHEISPVRIPLELVSAAMYRTAIALIADLILL